MFYTNIATIRGRIYVRGYSPSNERVFKKVGFKPKLYVTSNTPSLLKTVSGECVQPIEFKSISKFREYVKQNESNRRFKYFGMEDSVTNYIHETYPNEVEYKEQLIKILYLDIEVECEKGFPEPELADEAINAITMKQGNVLVTFGLGDYKPNGSGLYKKCKNEKELLRAFLFSWKRFDPDIVTGWNISLFDIPYLINRIRKLFGEKAVSLISPFGKIRERRVKVRKSQLERQMYVIYGLAVIDYIDLYRKFGTQNEIASYKLDYVAKLELDEKKLDYSQYGSLHLLYKNNFQKFIEYNVHDVLLVEKLEQKKKLIANIISMSYMCKVNYEDCFKPTKMWDSLIYGYLKERNYVVNRKVKTDKTEKYKGAYVKEARPGLYKWVVSYDLASLYPHIIMQYNIGPDTVIQKMGDFPSVESLLNKKFVNEFPYSVAANGMCFSKDSVSFLSALMDKLYANRVVYKDAETKAAKEYELTHNEETKVIRDRYANYQWVTKILLNSAYGALGNPHFRWYSVEQAEAITVSAQLAIKWISKELNEFLNEKLGTKDQDYILANDTDSAYLTFDVLVDKLCKGKKKHEIIDYLDKVSSTIIHPFIDKKFDELSKMMNAYKNRMSMNREIIADYGIWTAKKRYALRVWDMKGLRYKYPELKIVGLETVKSSVPDEVKQRIKNVLKLIMKGDQKKVQKYIELFRKRYYNLSFEEIASPRKINDLDKCITSNDNMLYKKGTPIHVRGAIVYNKAIKDYGLDRLYTKIASGDKVYFCYMKMPNPMLENVLSVKDELPPEFDIQSYIDYDLQFDKTFMKPVTTILDAIGWSAKPVSSLSSILIKRG